MVRARTRSNINLAGRADRLAAAARGKSPFLPPFPFFSPAFRFFTPPSVFLPRPPFFYPAFRFFTPQNYKGAGENNKGGKNGDLPRAAERGNSARNLLRGLG